jgi:hypothetical protein
MATPITCTDIVAEAIKDFNWSLRSNTNKQLIKKLLTIASQYGFTKETLLEKSMEEAKTLSNYKFIQEPHNITQFNGIDFIIHIDDNKRVWVFFRRNLKKDVINDDAKELISYLGAVYIYLSKNFNTSIDIYPDNVVQIAYDIAGRKAFKYITTKYPKYLRGYLDNRISVNDYTTGNIINPFMYMSGEFVEYINTYSEHTKSIPFNTKTIVLQNINNCQLSELPCGIKNISIKDTLVEPFHYMPPTIENIYILKLCTQLNGFPGNLKRLFINTLTTTHYCCPNKDTYESDKKVINNFEFELSNDVCYLCRDNSILEVYKLKYNDAIFPEGFQELIIDTTNAYQILDSITTIPSSFEKLILAQYDFYTYVYSSSIQEYNSFDNTECIKITKTINNFIKRFPNVLIVKSDDKVINIANTFLQ